MTISFSFHFFHSPFDVGGSMFDVHLLIRSMFKLLHLKFRSCPASCTLLTGFQLNEFFFQVRSSAKPAKATVASNHSVAGYQDRKRVIC